MTTTIEVFADVTCPFTHVGLKQILGHLATLPEPVEVWVRAWPLEWVNGQPLDADAVAVKAAALDAQLGVDDFPGFRTDHWPASTIPALNLAARAYGVDRRTGLAVSVALREALFESGQNIADHDVLARIAAAHAVPASGPDPDPTVLADYEEGKRRGVIGSPHIWLGDDQFFCPLLDIGHDTSGGLTARFEPEGLSRFLAHIPTSP